MTALCTSMRGWRPWREPPMGLGHLIHMRDWVWEGEDRGGWWRDRVFIRSPPPSLPRQLSSKEPDRVTHPVTRVGRRRGEHDKPLAPIVSVEQPRMPGSADTADFVVGDMRPAQFGG